jgi:hypothetical protein
MKDNLYIKAVDKYFQTVMTPFAPILSRCSLKHLRVAVWRNGDSYSIWVNNNTARYYTEKDLPDEVKEKMAIVLAVDDCPAPVGDLFTPNQFYSSKPCEAREYLEDIGWHVSGCCYCLILSAELVFKLRGEVYDTGRKSEGEGKETTG